MIHPGSRDRAQGAGGARLWKGVEHVLSPLNAPSLLDADTRQQSENAIACRAKRLSLVNDLVKVHFYDWRELNELSNSACHP